ncbi:MAG: hypothetical protein WBG38_11910 [Nodosilinea sp.]
MKTNKWRVLGAIAVFLWLVWWLWLLSNRRLWPDDGRPSHSERTTRVHQQRETPSAISEL